jgi:hypothetical protein
MKKKNIFGKYTQEQVQQAEATNFVILLGHDLFSFEGRYTFVIEDAEHYRDQIIGGLMEILENGSPAEIAEAEVCLCHLKIMPFRLH